jgi:hypothetical protein
LAIVFAVKGGRPLGELVGDILPAVTWTIAFSLVGAVVAFRRPHHRLGWIFCVVGLSQGLVTFTNEYAVYALWTTPGSVPGGPFMAWLATWDWAGSAPVLLTFLPLLFPDGRLPSPSCRPVAWLSAVPIALLCGPIAILYWPLRGRPSSRLKTSTSPPQAPWRCSIRWSVASWRCVGSPARSRSCFACAAPGVWSASS